MRMRDAAKQAHIPSHLVHMTTLRRQIMNFINYDVGVHPETKTYILMMS